MQVTEGIQEEAFGNNQSFLLEFWKHFWRQLSVKTANTFHELNRTEVETSKTSFFNVFFKKDALRSYQSSTDSQSLIANGSKATDCKSTITCDSETSNLLGHKHLQSTLESSTRSSRYRGVSRNGHQWQVLIMINKKKHYIGSFMSEEEAAREYDRVAIRNKGAKAKPNFSYTEEQVMFIEKDDSIVIFK